MTNNRRFLVTLILTISLLTFGSNWVIANAQENSYNTGEAIVSVTGNASLAVKPDMAQVVLGVETNGSTARAAQEKNAALMAKVVKKLKDMGIGSDSIKTERFDINPVYKYDKDDGSSKLDGYRATNQIMVSTTELSTVGQIIDGAVSSGATTIANVSFVLKDSTKAKIDALTSATADAKARAAAIASGLGLRIVGVRQATDGSVSVTPVTRTYAQEFVGAAVAKDMASTTIQEGEVQIRAQVSVEFLVK